MIAAPGGIEGRGVMNSTRASGVVSSPARAPITLHPIWVSSVLLTRTDAFLTDLTFFLSTPPVRPKRPDRTPSTPPQTHLELRAIVASAGWAALAFSLKIS